MVCEGETYSETVRSEGWEVVAFKLSESLSNWRLEVEAVEGELIVVGLIEEAGVDGSSSIAGSSLGRVHAEAMRRSAGANWH